MVILLIAFIFLSTFIVAVAGATPPPLEDRAAYLLPSLGTINISARMYLTVTDEPVPAFPPLSPYYASRNILDEKTGEDYVSECWYFNDWTAFSVQRTGLFAYLASHGTVSNTTLDISPELSRMSADPEIAEDSVHQVPVLAYESNGTSGYFVIFSTRYFPGESYYIAYYGLAGSSRLEDNSTLLNTFIMSVIPETLEHEIYVFYPSVLLSSSYSPSPSFLSLPWLTLLFLVVIGILVFYPGK